MTAQFTEHFKHGGVIFYKKEKTYINFDFILLRLTFDYLFLKFIMYQKIEIWNAYFLIKQNKNH